MMPNFCQIRGKNGGFHIVHNAHLQPEQVPKIVLKKTKNEKTIKSAKSQRSELLTPAKRSAERARSKTDTDNPPPPPKMNSSKKPLKRRKKEEGNDAHYRNDNNSRKIKTCNCNCNCKGN